MVAINHEIPMEQLANNSSRKVLAYSENVMTVEVYFEKGGFGTRHSHPHEQISYVVYGQVEYEIEGQTWILNQGDSIHVASNQNHSCKALEKTLLLDVFTPMRKDFIKE